ncbi:hypothetical protein F5B22DRAFT_295328 [Xylaria bambusicola]|uniref:uncharacterized protein n=1 Tax=Xylaria bambusicola TaxID=326684 RepID=UPI002007DE00|nr:uncharacterized protein F5B22DRAFT_295328 [Xylaria bambusicola]KAI0512811.1 hypothetical protein F5B22DRAFT_295328 [Xylaria bambusicola]
MASHQDWFRLFYEGLFWLVVSLLLSVFLYTAARKTQRNLVSEEANGRSKDMTLEEAYLVKTRIAEREFPFVFSAATNAVFFKAEGIPSIAKLVARAARRSTPRKGPSAAPLDLLGRPGASATKAAVDRVNYIHSFYRPSGKMSDDDLLYVLCLFALEPIRCVERFEYRRLTALERRALATLWKALGEELRIPFDRLGEGGGDALEWLAELERWGQEYEERFREKTPESVFLGEKQLDAWVSGVPLFFLRRWARECVAVLIEPGLRRAMGIETPSTLAVVLVESVIGARKFIRRCLCTLWW